MFFIFFYTTGTCRPLYYILLVLVKLTLYLDVLVICYI